MFLWSFLDSMFGLGFSTCRLEDGSIDTGCDAAFINGGSPTWGFLNFGTGGSKTAGLVDWMAPSAPNAINYADVLYMLGMLAVGVALVFGVAIRLGGIGGALGAGLLLRPDDRGGDHAPYFKGLSAALDGDRLATPTLVIDHQRMLENIATLGSHVNGRFDYRIVAKSLPSLPLLEAVMQASGSQRLMLFHQPFINQVARVYLDEDEYPFQFDK